MNHKKTRFTHLKNYLEKHNHLKTTFDYAVTLFMCILSAFIYSVGFRLFINPSSPQSLNFVASGVSGLSQIIVKVIVDIFGINIDRYVLQSILYSSLNIPVLVFAWIKVTKRFTIFSILNVLFTSLFIAIIPVSWANLVVLDTELTRTLLAGIFAGLCASIAFKFEHSAGGIDVFTYFFANRRSTNVGKYAITINVVIMLLYTAVSLIENYQNPAAYQVYVNSSGNQIFNNPLSPAITSLLYSVIYVVMSAIVVDLINIRNKKTQLQIITTNPDLSKELIVHFHHGCTIVKGTGAYTGNERFVLYMTISSSEVRRAIELIQQIDPHVFVNVTAVHQVYGRFYIRPVK